jgi:hypothetical protein
MQRRGGRIGGEEVGRSKIVGSLSMEGAYRRRRSRKRKIRGRRSNGEG